MRDDKIKRISDEEIDKHYAFTRKHFVEYYDLQTLVSPKINPDLQF